MTIKVERVDVILVAKNMASVILTLTLVYTYQTIVHAEESRWYSLEMRCTEFLCEQITRIPNFANWNTNWITSQQWNSKKKRPEYPKPKTESEFRFRWGAQTLEQKIRIPNLDERFGKGTVKVIQLNCKQKG
jgi:hypothetical protein